jgi:hypothetical protein
MTKRSETSLVYSPDATAADGIRQKLQLRVEITILVTLTMCVAVLRRGFTSEQTRGFHEQRKTVSESFRGTRTVTSHILAYALRLDKDDARRAPLLLETVCLCRSRPGRTVAMKRTLSFLPANPRNANSHVLG